MMVEFRETMPRDKNANYKDRKAQKISQNACKKVEIKKSVSVPSLRPSFATHLLESGEVEHGQRNKNNGYPEGCIYEQFAYTSNLAGYSNSSYMNELAEIKQAASNLKQIMKAIGDTHGNKKDATL